MLNTFLPHPKPPPNVPNSEEGIPASNLMAHPNMEGASSYTQMLLLASTPSRPLIHFYPTRNPRQMCPTARRASQGSNLMAHPNMEGASSYIQMLLLASIPSRPLMVAERSE